MRTHISCAGQVQVKGSSCSGGGGCAHEGPFWLRRTDSFTVGPFIWWCHPSSTHASVLVPEGTAARHKHTGGAAVEVWTPWHKVPAA